MRRWLRELGLARKVPNAANPSDSNLLLEILKIVSVDDICTFFFSALHSACIPFFFKIKINNKI